MLFYVHCCLLFGYGRNVVVVCFFSTCKMSSNDENQSLVSRLYRALVDMFGNLGNCLDD